MKPEPDPVVMIAGGPGRLQVKFGSDFSRVLNPPQRLERDIVLIDQRGVGYSEPHVCTNLSRDVGGMIAADLTREGARARELELVTACQRELAAAGLSFDMFSPAEVAADLNDARSALGYTTWNIHGSGYGTIIALELMNRHPTTIRSAILDSPFPVGVDEPEARTQAFSKALEKLFASCAADARCNAAFPDLRTSFANYVHARGVRPARAQIHERYAGQTEFVVNDHDSVFSTFAGLGLAETRALSLMPLIMSSDPSRVSPALAEQMLAVSGFVNRAFYYPAKCTSRGRFAELVRRPQLTAAEQQLRTLLVPIDSERAICDRLAPDVRPPAEILTQHATEIPTLAFIGEFDPETRMEVVGGVLGRMARSTVVHIPEAGLTPTGGHSQNGACARKIATSFLARPGEPPDQSCIRDLPQLEFTTGVVTNYGIASLARAVLLAKSVPALLGLAATVGLLLLSFAWPAAAVLARARGRRQPRDPHDRRLALLACATAWLGLAFLFGLFAGMLRTAADNAAVLAVGLPNHLAVLLCLPYALALLVVAVIAGVVLVWRRTSWSTLARVHYTAVAIGCGGLMTLCAKYQLFLT